MEYITSLRGGRRRTERLRRRDAVGLERSTQPGAVLGGDAEEVAGSLGEPGHREARLARRHVADLQPPAAAAAARLRHLDDVADDRRAAVAERRPPLELQRLRAHLRHDHRPDRTVRNFCSSTPTDNYYTTTTTTTATPIQRPKFINLVYRRRYV